MSILTKTKVYVADDHAILRDGLRVILESTGDFEIIGECGDGKEALEEIERKKPDLAILDISMPSMRGIEVARQLKKYHPDIKVIMLSRHDNIAYVKKLLEIGIDGYVLKENAADDLTRAIDAAFKGSVYLSPEVTGTLITAVSDSQVSTEQANPDIFSELTERERQILKLIAEGKSNNDIGNSLFISPATVKTHRINIMRKLDIHNLADLVRYAIQNGLIET